LERGLYILVLPELIVCRRPFGTLVSILEPFLSLSLTHIGWDCILVRLRAIYIKLLIFEALGRSSSEVVGLLLLEVAAS
jgi:hypothetical protein